MSLDIKQDTMTNHDFKKGIEELKDIRMTSSEKAFMLNEILANTPVHIPVKSPWSVYSFSLFINKHKLISAFAVLVIIFGTGGGVASAAQGSLPGDMLYGVKTGITEPLSVVFAPTPEKRAEVQASLVTKRFVEAETLATRGKLDEKKEAKLQSLIEKHTEEFSNTVAMASLDDEAIKETHLNLEAGLEAHAKVLDTILDHGSIEARAQQDDSATRSLAAMSVATKIAKKNSLSDVARENARKISKKNTNNSDLFDASLPVDQAGSTSVVSSKKSDSQEVATTAKKSKPNKIDERKAKTQRLISETKRKLEETKNLSKDSESQVHVKLIQDSDESLGRAEKILESVQGQSDSENDLIEESTKSAKEASIILDAGLKVEKESQVRKNSNKNKARDGYKKSED